MGAKLGSLTLKEERRLRKSDNRVLRRIFGPNREELTWEWRKPHNEERNDLYSSPIIIQGSDQDKERRASSANFLKGKYLEEYMVLSMKTGNGKVGRIEN